MVAITPQIQSLNRKLVDRLKLNFDVLYDQDNQYAQTLDLVHGFPQDLKDVYGGFGINLDDANGNAKWELPIPSRMVVDASGVIQHVHVDPDYTARPEPAVTLDQVKSLE
jgi:peroxiredoxin